jgi:hypothetical protein
MYSIDQNILFPPLSMIMGLMLVYGLYVIGNTLSKALRLEMIDRVYASIPVSIVFGAAILSSLLAPLVTLQLASRISLKAIANVLICLSILHLITNWRLLISKIAFLVNCTRVDYRVFKCSDVFLKLIYGFYFLLSLGAVTNADSLDYHLGAAISILNNHGLIYQPEWIHGRLAGSQEYLNAYGLASGSEQFGSIIQFFSFAAIAVCLNALRKRRHNQLTDRERRGSDYLFMSVMTAPVFIFLVTSSKPDLWGIAISTIGFALIVEKFVLFSKEMDDRVLYAVVAFLAFSAYAAKFKFILSAATLLLLLLVLSYKQRNFIAAVIAILIPGVWILAPPVLFKMQAYDATLYEVLLSPIPTNTPGIKHWLSGAATAGDTNSVFPYPLSVFLPDRIGALTSVLGMSLLVVVSAAFVTGSRVKSLMQFSAYGLLAVTILLAPPSARNIIEPIIWISLAVLACGKYRGFVSEKWYSAIVGAQVFLSITIAFIGVLMLFPSALSAELRKQVLENNANGYTMMDWVDRVAPIDAVILTPHRSIALMPRQSVSFDWQGTMRINALTESFYMQRLVEAKVTHILMTVDPAKNEFLQKCIDKVIKGESVNNYATRNPFNRQTAGDAWLVKLNDFGIQHCKLSGL